MREVRELCLSDQVDFILGSEFGSEKRKRFVRDLSASLGVVDYVSIYGSGADVATAVLLDAGMGEQIGREVLNVMAHQDSFPTAHVDVQRALKLMIAQAVMSVIVDDHWFRRQHLWHDAYKSLVHKSEVLDLHNPELSGHTKQSVKFLSALPDLLAGGDAGTAVELMELVQDSFAAVILANHKDIDIPIPVCQPKGFGLLDLHQAMSALQAELVAMEKALKSLSGQKDKRPAQHLVLLLRGAKFLMQQYYSLSDVMVAEMSADSSEYGHVKKLSGYRAQMTSSQMRNSIDAYLAASLEPTKIDRRIRFLEGWAGCAREQAKVDEREACELVEEEKSTERLRSRPMFSSRYAMFKGDEAKELTRSLLSAEDGDGGELVAITAPDDVILRV